MPDLAVIPIRSFRLGKRRLSGSLTAEHREQLGERLATHVALTVMSAGVTPLVVSADADVAGWATRNGFTSIPDPERGLDAAAQAGVEWAESSQSRWAVLHSDLPALAAEDVRLIFDSLDTAASVIAPSSDGGTSALASRTPVRFAYGPASFHRHLARLTDPVVLTSTGLLLDLDSPHDLRAASRYLS